MTEKSRIETPLVRWAQNNGGIAAKLVLDSNERGFPDRSLFMPDGILLLAECKDAHGKPTPHQKRWLDRLESRGHFVTIAKEITDIEELYAKALQVRGL